jgi:hypothetical protein
MTRPPRLAPSALPERDRVIGTERNRASRELNYLSPRLPSCVLATTMRMSRNLSAPRPMRCDTTLSAWTPRDGSHP